VALPAGSGTGRRAVYDIGDQRVWIVDADGTVERTYPVSGSLENNLKTGTYSVYSRSLDAEGVDDSGYMRYFVRFAYGTDQGASIGFHSIPTTEPEGQGRPLQTLAELGHRESHGCIRQATPDAIAMWNFAQVGTKVVVLA
jgi:lipoprotein-anchoring transpeptidase ErfK/SrfK